ncbi:hypothetical protein [Chryseobacterium sp. A321]
MKNRVEIIKGVIQNKGQMCIIYSDHPEALAKGRQLTIKECESEIQKGTMILNINIGQGKKPAVLIKLADFSVKYFYNDKNENDEK